MRDLKTLRELVASVTNWETLEKLSCKPFKPKLLDVAIAAHAPKLYSKEEFDQIKYCCKQHFGVELKSPGKNVEVETRKRQIEETPKKERVMPLKKRPKNTILITNNQPSSSSSSTSQPDLPAEFKNRVTELNGCDLKFIMHKILFWSDVNTNSNRLSMPINEIKYNFLTEIEVAQLDERDEKGRLVGVEVTVLDPCLREFTLPLKEWKMTTKTYNLVTSWNKIVSVNRFEANQEIQIWSFRVHDKLYFLLNKL